MSNKNITTRIPDWFRDNPAYREFLLGVFNDCGIAGENHPYSLDLELCAFSKVRHRAIVQIRNCVKAHDIKGFYMVDFDERTSLLLSGTNGSDEFCASVITHDKFRWLNGDVDAGFIQLTLFGGKKLILDGNLGNAPDMTNSGSFDLDFDYKAELINSSLLYFDYNGRKYLVDGDYHMVGKFYGKLDTNFTTTGYINDNTTQFYICQETSPWKCLYDMMENGSIFGDIVYIGNSGKNFIRSNGDIYAYDSESGKFVLKIAHDKYLDMDGMLFVKTIVLSQKYHNPSVYDSNNVVAIFRCMEGAYHLVHGGVVINKECAFDEVDEIRHDDGHVTIRCKVGKIVDIYDGFNHFKFNMHKLRGEDKLWFEK